jgi:hypothetical protein
MEIKVLLVLIISGIFTFLLLSSLIIPFFATTYEYGFGTEPCNKKNTCAGNFQNNSGEVTNSYCKTKAGTFSVCANCNTSTGYATFLSTCGGLIAIDGVYVNGTHCFGCTEFQGYKTTNQGLMLFVFFIIVVTLIIVLVKTFKGRK